MKLVTMVEAAQRMGVSVDTVRRRLRRGELLGHHQPTPQGFIWLAQLPEQSGSTAGLENGAEPVRSAPAYATAGTFPARAGATSDIDPSAGDIRAIRELVDVLRHEIDTRDRHLESKDRQIEQLHALLQQAQAVPQSGSLSPSQPRT